MRVIAGSAKRTRLGSVPAGTRPVSDRAREGIFSSLGADVEEARVLDLFAGTGAMGIEALSRGARSALFVDSAPRAARTIQDNLGRTKLTRGAQIRSQDVRKALQGTPGPFDLVLMDPPYRIAPGDLDVVIGLLGPVLAPGAVVVLTRPVGGYIPVIPLDWRVARRLSYGDTVVLVFGT